MRVFVTGSSGFIGARLVHALRARGDCVQGVDWQAASEDGVLRTDLRKVSPNELREFDACVHLASDVGGFLHNAEDRGQVQYECELLRAVAALCRAKGCKRLVYTSSIAVFERAATFEHGALRWNTQRSHYARAKAEGERLVATLFDEFAVVRPTNVFGAVAPSLARNIGQSHVIPDLLRKIRAGETVEVMGDGRQVRNFVHVDDVVRFIITVLGGPARGWYNVRSNIQLSIAELARELLAITGVRRELVFRPEFLAYEPRPIEAFDMTEPLALGWRPLVTSLRDGMASASD
jgi:UDP-glucose 4-epimerase